MQSSDSPTSRPLELGQPVSPNLSPLLKNSKSDSPCPLCGFAEWTYQFISHGVPVYRCNNCGLIRLHPQPTRSEVPSFYANSTGHDPFAGGDLADSLTEREASVAYLKSLARRGASKSGILLVAPRGHPFAEIAEKQGYDIETCLDTQELDHIRLADGHYHSVVVVFQLEKAANPVGVLRQIHAALEPEGRLLLVTPSLESWSARFFRNQWTEWRPENLYYFDPQTIQSVLFNAGFAKTRITQDRRRYSLQHMYGRARAFPRTGLTRLVRAMYHIMPPPLCQNMRVELTASGMIVTGQRVEQRSRPLLSIIMPAYNECSTFTTTMDAVLAKEVQGIDKEVIVVESNSTDGTRELVLTYQRCLGVKVILQDRPKGKGNAVRAGFKYAEGDFILIQDADEEYDVNDYDALIEPLQTYKRTFVLGSRHTGDWKIRKFNDQPGITNFFNIGHLVFMTLLNLMYRQSLKDPFTMYKVFRRDCLHGLKFECNRFDFDFELVIKLVRKGYTPLEIPVNYQARSFKEGKRYPRFGILYPGLDLRQTAVVEKLPIELENLVNENDWQIQSVAGSAKLINLGELNVEVNTSAPGLLIVTDQYYPGWQAFIDGKQAAIYAVDGIFRGVFLEEGDHIIQFKYQPLWFIIGGIISSLSLLITVIFIISRSKVLPDKYE